MSLRYSEEQRRAIRLFDRNLVVSAAAGSGKTTLLVERFFHAVTAEGVPPEKILAITFTEKAAQEMKTRLIARADEENLAARRQELENAPVSTIHSFCARVLRENPVEAGVDPFFRILSETEAELLTEKMLDRLFEEEAGNSVWLEHLADIGEESARQAIRHFYDLSRAVADAPQLFRCPNHPAEKQRAFRRLCGFVNRCLEGLESRRGKRSAPEERFKAVLERLRAWAAAPSPNEAARVAQLSALRDMFEKRSPKIKDEARKLETLIDAWILFALEDVLAPAKREFLKVFSRFKAIYEAEKRKMAAYDFEDLVYLTYQLFSDPAPERKKVLARLRGLFSRILVDEYQDTSPLQAAIIDRLKRGNRSFFVGDTRQSIYGFRHADPWVFERLIREGRRGGHEQVSLSRNHRARKEILDWINCFFQSSSQRLPFTPLEAGREFAGVKPHSLEVLCVERGGEIRTLDEARAAEARLLSHRLRELVDSGVRVEEKDGASRPLRCRDIAVLFRSATSSYFYEEEFSKAGLPFHVLKGRGFYDKAEIVDLLSCLQILENPEEDVALACVLRSPLVAVSDDTLFWLARCAKTTEKEAPLFAALCGAGHIQEILRGEKERLARFCAQLEAWGRARDHLRLSDLIRRVVVETNLGAKLLARESGRQRLANVRKLVEIARLDEEKASVSVGDFVRTLKGFSEREVFETEASLENGAGDAVTLSTVHAAKGLEFPCVVIADMGADTKRNSRGPVLAAKEAGVGMKWLNPLTREWTADFTYSRIEEQLRRREREEDERVLYVAMTRAKEHLILSGSSAAGSKRNADSWMEKVIAVLGNPPGPVFQRVIRRMPAPRQEPAPGRVLARELGLHEGLFRTEAVRVEEVEPPLDYRQRFNAVPKEYSQTRDLTVTDVWAASLEGREREALVLEEDRFPAPEEEPRLPRNEFGTLFHKLMEILAVERPKAVRNEFFEPPFLEMLAEAERAEMRRSVLEFWRGPWGRSVRQARRCYPELPFIYKTPRGLLKGQMDLVFQAQTGEWVLLDYKTNRITTDAKESLAEKYKLQLSLYALVFSRLYGAIPKGVLYFAAIHEASEFTFRPEDFAALERRLGAILTRQQKVCSSDNCP